MSEIQSKNAKMEMFSLKIYTSSPPSQYHGWASQCWHHGVRDPPLFLWWPPLVLQPRTASGIGNRATDHTTNVWNVESRIDITISVVCGILCLVVSWKQCRSPNYTQLHNNCTHSIVVSCFSTPITVLTIVPHDPQPRQSAVNHCNIIQTEKQWLS